MKQNNNYYGEDYDDVRLKRASENGKLPLGNTRCPKFCEVIRSIWAHKENPLRDGYFISSRKTDEGKCIWYKLTDGKGEFWECEASDTVYVGINPLESKSWQTLKKVS